MELKESVGLLARRLNDWHRDMNRGVPGGTRDPRAAEARAALAHLRHGLGRRPGEAVEAFRYVLPCLPAEGVPDGVAETFFLVATLFAAHPLPRSRADGERAWTLGHTFWQMERDERDRPSDPVEANERRFVALLRASGDSLAGHLRHAVRLAAGKGAPIDYYQLTWDLLGWDDPERGGDIRRRWAAAYWGRHFETTTPEGEENVGS